LPLTSCGAPSFVEASILSNRIAYSFGPSVGIGEGDGWPGAGLGVGVGLGVGLAPGFRGAIGGGVPVGRSSRIGPVAFAAGVSVGIGGGVVIEPPLEGNCGNSAPGPEGIGGIAGVGSAVGVADGEAAGEADAPAEGDVDSDADGEGEVDACGEADADGDAAAVAAGSAGAAGDAAGDSGAVPPGVACATARGAAAQLPLSIRRMTSGPLFAGSTFSGAARACEARFSERATLSMALTARRNRGLRIRLAGS
jgi:hypothetical protein